MEEARTPFLDLLEAFLQQVLGAMLFPETARIWVAVESETKRAHRITQASPTWRASIRGQPNPRRGALQESLCVRLLSVCLFHTMSWEHAVAISGLGRFHSCRAAAQLLEQSDIPVFIFHVVSLENNAAFEFIARVPIRELRPFLNADREDPSHVSFLAGSFALG
jgi:hypothetical protein